MELRHLQYFIAVAEELSFTRASRRLHVVQSGVSSAIQALERELGATLFDRNRHRVSLTDAGHALLPEARATLAAAEAARDAVHEAHGGLRGTLTIGTMLSTGRLDVPELLGRFHTTHPGVAVRLRLAPAGSAELARDVTAGALDLAFLSLPGPPPAGLVVRPISEEPLVVVCHAENPLAHPPSEAQQLHKAHEPYQTQQAQTRQAEHAGVTLSRLAEERFVDFPPGWGNRAVVDRAFAAEGLERQVPFEVADFGAATGLVRLGLAIAFLPATAAAAHDDLRTVEVAGPPLIWRIFVGTPAGRRASAAARAFLAAVLTRGDDPPEPPGSLPN
ncbi:MAG: LysR substrate-binding domain-containing protein [Micromonosporaceae bacterium]